MLVRVGRHVPWYTASMGLIMWAALVVREIWVLGVLATRGRVRRSSWESLKGERHPKSSPYREPAACELVVPRKGVWLQRGLPDQTGRRCCETVLCFSKGACVELERALDT